MANETVGEMRCMHCGDMCEVRQNKKGKFYLYCKENGLVQPTLQPFQEKVKREAIMYGDGKAYNGGPEPEPETPAAPASPETMTQVKPEPKKSSLFSRLGRAILEE